jgi:general secretion pathway protein D
MKRSWTGALLAGAMTIACFPPSIPAQTPTPSGPPPLSPMDRRAVRTTILDGTPPVRPPAPPPVDLKPGGDVSLNFPGADVQGVAKAILGDTLGAPYSIDPNLHVTVTVQTPRPIQRSDVIGVLEQGLNAAGLALANRAGTYVILPMAQAQGDSPVVGPNDTGFGNETVALKFVNAEEMRKLLDPLVPNAVSTTDPAHNTLVITGSSTRRAALRELVAQFDVDWLRGMSFALLIPQRSDARLIAPELDRLLNAPGAASAGLVKLIAMDRLNGILAITAQPQYLDDVRRFVELLDREGESNERKMFVYHVQNGRAADLAKVINAAFGGGGSGLAHTDTDATFLSDHSSPTASTAPPASTPPGLTGGPRGGLAGAATESSSFSPGAGGGGTTITADETNNAIVVFAKPRDFAVISDGLAKLDVPPLQVMIDASISEVTLNHSLQYGIQWAFQAGRLGGVLSQGVKSGMTNASTGVSTVVNPGPQQNFPGLSFLYQGANVSATLNALSAVTDVTVLSAPKVMVLNNHTATIEVGDQVPISTGSAVSTISSNAPIVNSIEYRDTGIILKVTPRVNAGGLVLLDIAQEVSNVQSTTTSSISSPTIQQRKISTSVAVQDGETIALGGLIKNNVIKGRSTIPLLGAIPILGHLFGDTTGGLVRTELVVLLTPRVVRTPVDARAVTEELRERIRLAAPQPRRHAP